MSRSFFCITLLAQALQVVRFHYQLFKRMLYCFMFVGVMRYDSAVTLHSDEQLLVFQKIIQQKNDSSDSMAGQRNYK